MSPVPSRRSNWVGCMLFVANSRGPGNGWLGSLGCSKYTSSCVSVDLYWWLCIPVWLTVVVCIDRFRIGRLCGCWSRRLCVPGVRWLLWLGGRLFLRVLCCVVGRCVVCVVNPHRREDCLRLCWVGFRILRLCDVLRRHCCYCPLWSCCWLGYGLVSR